MALEDNHKIPALLPHKTVKALQDNIGLTDKGGVEVGHDLEVDGNVIVNGADNIVDKDGNKLVKVLYQHTLQINITTLTDGVQMPTGKIRITALASKNTPIDSFQDLTAVFGHKILAWSGVWKYNSVTSYGGILDLKETSTTGVTLYGYPSAVTAQSMYFGKLLSEGTITYIDDVVNP